MLKKRHSPVTSQQAPDAPVILTEYGSTLATFSIEQARELRHAARDAITVQADDTPGTWRVTASHFVGTIVTTSLRIMITPKVDPDNLFYMLEASGRPVSTGAATFSFATSPDLIPSFATFYARSLEGALTRGVPHAYQEMQDRLPAVRGRVNIPAQIRMAGLSLPTESSFDEYTADTRLARVLRSAAFRLLRLPGVTVPTRQALQRLAAILTDAGPATPADLQTPTVFTRLDEHCRSAEHLARIVLDNRALRCAVGTAGAAVFLIDMNVAFETFVADRLARYLAGQVNVLPQQTRLLGKGGTGRIRPDLIFEKPVGKPVYVADTKYKITADGYGRDADYYQILAYTRALDVPGGMLIYCQRDGDAPARSIAVGIHQTSLDSWALALRGKPADIEHRLKHLAERIAESASI